MNELTTINDIVSNAVKDSSYVTVLISSCIFILYTLIIKIVDIVKAKDRSKPLLEMASAVKEVSENVLKLNQVLDRMIQDAQAKEISRISHIISTAFNSFKGTVITYCIDIIIHNNIENRQDVIKQNIYKTVSTEYYKLYSIFSSYEHDSVNLASKIKEDWIEEITNECFDVIYGESDSLNKIRQLNNKLTIDTEQYSIYLNNKIFTH